LFRSAKGYTMVELIVVIGIFSLFLIAFYATMNIGLKQWKIGEVRSDLLTTGELVMKRIAGELELANHTTIDALYTPGDPNSNTYLCFSLPVYEGIFQSDLNTGDILWQGHVLYYTLPDTGDNDYHTKKLYRKYIPHSTTSPYKSTDIKTPTMLDSINTYLTVSTSGGQVVKRICEKLFCVRFEQKKDIVYIEMEFIQNIRKSKDAKVSFETGSNVGTERFIIKNAVKIKN